MTAHECASVVLLLALLVVLFGARVWRVIRAPVEPRAFPLVVNDVSQLNPRQRDHHANDDRGERRGGSSTIIQLRLISTAEDACQAISELDRPFEGGWPIEAAELLGDAALYPVLQAVWQSLSPEDKTHFERSFLSAFEACAPKDKQPAVS